MRSALGAMSLVILCTACVSTNAAVLNPSVSYQKICPDGVEMFTSAERVPGPYQEVALLNSKGESGWTDENQMMRSQQKKAASLGANGIILGDTKEPNAGTKIIGSLLGTGAERKGKAVAIFIPSDTLRVQRMCKTTPQALDRAFQPEEESAAPTTAPFGLAPAPTRTAAEHPAAQLAPAPVRLVVPTAAPAASGAPVDTATIGQSSVGPVAGFTKLPVGTNYVGDTRIRVYYPIGCAAQHAIPAESQVFFRTAGGAEGDGFKLSGDC
jgi:hypothetical protein